MSAALIIHSNRGNRVLRRFGLLLLFAALAPLRASEDQQAQPVALTAQDLSEIAEIPYVPISVSADGRYVAYTLNTPNRRSAVDERDDAYYLKDGTPREANGDEVWVVELGTGKLYRPTGGELVSWGGIWSPDGRQLAFLSNRGGAVRVWVWDLASKMSHCISEVEAKVTPEWRQLWWTPDSRQLLLRVVTEGTGHPTSIADRQKYKSHGITVFKSSHTGEQKQLDMSGAVFIQGDLALVDVSTGNVRRIVRDVPVFGYWLSPAGGQVAYTVLQPHQLNASDPDFDLIMADIRKGAPRTLARQLKQIWANTVSWSPDSSKIAYEVGTRAQLYEKQGSSDQYYVFDLQRRKSILASPGNHPSFEARANQGPLWSEDSSWLYLIGGETLWRAAVDGRGLEQVGTVAGKQLRTVIGTGAAADRLWTPDKKSARVITFDMNSRATGIARVDLAGGGATQLFEEDAQLGSGADGFYGTLIAAQGESFVYVRQSSSEPEDLRVADSEIKKARKITNVNPQLSHYKFGQSRLVQWSGPDGKVLHGNLVMPSNYQMGHRYPLVVEVYGGSYLSKNINVFGAGAGVVNVQLLATRGYAVFLPDTPISDSPVLNIANGVLSGVNFLIKMGVADPERLAVMGHSYGGYSALAVLTQSSQFKAAIDVSGGASNLFTDYGALRKGDGDSIGIAWAESGQGRMGGTPWQVRSRYIENSPFFFLDKVTTPILIINATGDAWSPTTAGGDELFSALRRLGQEVEYVLYDGEDHSPSEWSKANQEDYYNRVIAWLNRFLVIGHIAVTDNEAVSAK